MTPGLYQNGKSVNILDALAGYKTYFMALACVIYGVGIDYHWWTHSLTLDSILGGGTLAALRSALKSVSGSSQDVLGAVQALLQAYPPAAPPPSKLTPAEQQELAALLAKQQGK